MDKSLDELMAAERKGGKRGRDDRRGGGGGGWHDDRRSGGSSGWQNRGGGGGGSAWDRLGGGGGGRGGGQRHSYGGGGHGSGGWQRHGGGGGGYGGGHKRARSDGGGYGGGPTPSGEKLDDEGYLWFDEDSGVCTYFQDRRRKWPFTTSAAGKEHLQALVVANTALRKRNASLLEAAGEPRRVEAEGERLYVEKPTLRGDQNVTWSFEEYGHPGLQLYYLKLKSWQRFTETYALLERAYRRGLFDAPLPEGRPLRVVTLGGGPGYELLAAQRFFGSVVGATELELINTDVQPTWRDYSEALGFRFEVHDITKDSLEKTCTLELEEIDYVIVSYVCIYVAKQPGHPMHEAVCDEFKRLLDKGVRAILVSERSEETAACDMMEARGVSVERLIEQGLGKDERQSLFLSEAAAPLPKPRPTREADDRELTFTNVPFEEHKIKRGGAAGAGGSQTKWYS